jgi:hypothetical protein
MAITKLVADSLGAGATPNQSAFKNIIINGDMSIAQRSTSVASITTGGYYTVDRFNTNLTTLGTWTQSQSTDVPSGQGFAKSLKMDCTTADASPASGDLLRITQLIEGQNLQYLKKGSSSAESLTCSFWVKSNKTGTYILEIRDRDNSRAISKSYTILSSNTWEKKTITFAGDTTGAFNNDNGSSLELVFWLGAGTNFTSGTLATSWGSRTDANTAVGQVNLGDSTSNEWYVTGVQLEAGTSASDFEFLPYDVNLARCQRYFRKVSNGIGVGATATSISFKVDHLSMRATPSYTSTANLKFTDFYLSNPTSTTATVNINANNEGYGNLNNNDFSGLTTGRLYSLGEDVSRIFASSEL